MKGIEFMREGLAEPSISLIKHGKRSSRWPLVSSFHLSLGA